MNITATGVAIETRLITASRTIHKLFKKGARVLDVLLILGNTCITVESSGAGGSLDDRNDVVEMSCTERLLLVTDDEDDAIL